MSCSSFNNVCLKAVCSCVPKNEIHIDDELDLYGNDKDKLARVKKIAGLNTRRVAPPGVTAADLCIYAARNLLKMTHCSADSIDCLIFITQSPDYIVPATSFIIQKELSLGTDCALFDINLGCSGYVYGLWLGACMIASGATKKVLLLAGDSGAHYINKSNRIVAPIFGDAGSASLLEYKAGAPALSFSLGNDGSGYDAIIRPGGGYRIPHIPSDDSNYTKEITDPYGNPWIVGGAGNIWMDGKSVFDFTMSRVPEHIKKHLSQLNLNPADLDFLILHQANRQIVKNIMVATGFTAAQTPIETLKKYGNQSVASIPCVICDQLKNVCESGAPLHMMLCGYGIGFSWGSCIGDFTGLQCCGILDFCCSESVPSRGERIGAWHKKFSGETDNGR